MPLQLRANIDNNMILMFPFDKLQISGEVMLLLEYVDTHKVFQ